jgi:glycosyltransferase involved in cell wall biosynthesis
VLGECLDSIEAQEFDGTLEVVVADGGSTDNTVAIASERGCLVVDNPGRTGEAGKARAFHASSGRLVALIDSDNILPRKDWLSRMTAPFIESHIAASEPLEYTVRDCDSLLTRYCALMGMNDPLCYFLGNYDRMCVLSGKWTGLPVESEDMGDYLEIRLHRGAIPTIGANGFVVRRELVDGLVVGEYLFDIDIVARLVDEGYDRFAKVKVGIVHLYGTGLRAFSRKQLRRIRDFSFYSSQGMRSYPWGSSSALGLVKFILCSLLVVPLVYQAMKGYLRKADSAWLLHVPACIITLVVYCYGYIEGRVRPREQERSRWRQ